MSQSDYYVLVSILPAGAITAGAQWSIDGGVTWKNSVYDPDAAVPGFDSSKVVLVTPSELNGLQITFKSCAGYIAPAIGPFPDPCPQTNLTLSDGTVVNWDGSSAGAYWRMGEALYNLEATYSLLTPPLASFTKAPSSSYVAQSVAFTDTSTNYPTSWLWDFGDGYQSAAQNPTHAYAAAGTYTVSLTASNTAGPSVTATQSCTVTASTPYVNVTIVPAGAVTSGAEWSADGGTTWHPSGTPVNLNPASLQITLNNVVGYITPTVGAFPSSVPESSLTLSGGTSVEFTEDNTEGTCTWSITVIYILEAPQPGFTFTIAPGGPYPLTVNFRDASTGTPTSWSWNFGDLVSGADNTSTLQNPSHIYTQPGSYAVSLESTNAAGSSVFTQINCIVIAAPPIAPPPPTPFIVMDIIKGAMRKIGATMMGEIPSEEETYTCLADLNEMIDAWSADRLMLRSTTSDSFTLIPGQYSYTIGPGAAFNTAKPINIRQAYIVDGNSIVYELKIVDKFDVNAMNDRLWVTSEPIYIAYDPGLAQQAVNWGTIYFYFTPDASLTYQLYLESDKYLTEFVNPTDVVTFEPAYREALIYGLAGRIYREFHGMTRPIPQDIIGMAARSLARIKRLSYRPLRPRMEFPSSAPPGYNPYTDSWT